MTEPAELLLIKDQYELAFHSLSRGLAAEEAGKREEALMFYRKGQQHLTQGMEVPTGGERHLGAVWDTARGLQQRMRDTLRTVNTHLSDPEASQLTKGCQRGRLLMNLPPNLYPDLTPCRQPPQSSLNHLYPTVAAATQDAALTLQPSLPSCARLQTLPAATHPGDQPPAYTPQPTVGHRSLSYAPAEGGLRPGKQAAAAGGGGDGNELLHVPSGVQMFFVAPSGQVSSLSHPGYLRIVQLDSEHKGSTAGKASTFLQVCDCLFLLEAGTPVLLANSGIFMFRDTLSETPGSYVGIVLSSELPPVHGETFQALLSQLANLRVQGPEGEGSDVMNLSDKIPLGPMKEHEGLTVPTGKKEKPPLPGWSEKMAQGILTGATRLSVGFAKGAEATGRAINKGAAKLREHITPEETPSEVSPHVTKSLEAARQATGGAVRVSQFIVNGVSTVAGLVAEKMAPHVKKQGSKLVPESMKTSKDGGPSSWDGAKFVAISSVHGLSTVWSSLETGAKLVGKSVTAETVTTVTHKYGNDAGTATDTGLKSVINVAVAAYNFDNLGIKAFMKTTGKQTAKAVAKPREQPAQTQAKEPLKREHQEETKGKEKVKKQTEN
uniref:Spartin a n=1 Tax=Gasterosteus aculeatus aculeatus TaxID=481459 RepID=A0AAQ4PUT9_GASAC|nr:spartin a isoform X1 [Gasterosteus aculeatus aculeatus]